MHLAQSGRSATLAIEIPEAVNEEKSFNLPLTAIVLGPGPALPRPIGSLLDMTCVGKVPRSRVNFP
jgi:anthranilate/para-aminobenzoate synthase component II